MGGRVGRRHCSCIFLDARLVVPAVMMTDSIFEDTEGVMVETKSAGFFSEGKRNWYHGPLECISILKIHGLRDSGLKRRSLVIFPHRKYLEAC